MTSWAYFRWDAMPIRRRRLGLYGLYAASKVFGIWAVVYAVLASTKVVGAVHRAGDLFSGFTHLAPHHPTGLHVPAARRNMPS